MASQRFALEDDSAAFGACAQSPGQLWRELGRRVVLRESVTAERVCVDEGFAAVRRSTRQAQLTLAFFAFTDAPVALAHAGTEEAATSVLNGEVLVLVAATCEQLLSLVVVVGVDGVAVVVGEIPKAVQWQK